MLYLVAMIRGLLLLLLCWPGWVLGQDLLPLLSPWQLQQTGEAQRIAAPVPGNVYQALLAAERIPHPYLGSGEDSVQWVGEKTWLYSSRFWLDPQAMPADLALHFERIDTWADIRLNGQLLGTANNAFHTWEFPIAAQQQPGWNELEVRIYSIQSINDSLAARAPQPLPEGQRVFVRKPAFQFGWDWGPKLTAGGLPGAVHFRQLQQTRISAWQHQLLALDSQHALLQFDISFENLTRDCSFDVRLSGTAFDYDHQFSIPAGSRSHRFQIDIPEPRRWWPNGMGEAHLYALELSLHDSLGPVQLVQAEIGLRTITLVQEADTYGRSFYFEVNGQPLFVKGANYIPTSHLPGDAPANSDSLLLLRAADMGLNMLRSWGGGWYPSDDFYRLADRLGLLVWQDFMFACAMYPGDTAFLRNVQQEADHQIKRLRHHASLALWCGNNENWEGWGNWGWQRQLGYSAADSLAVQDAYTRLFRELLPARLAVLDPQTSYSHSSPLNGWGRQRAYREGDVHYWGVWWGMEPLEQYREKVGRFVSEYGMQSLPEYRSLQRMVGADSLPLQRSDPRLRQHQKHPTGFETIQNYLERDFPVPASLPLYAYASQLLQLRAMETAIEAHRNAMPYCMGTLFWQWNDVWPAISWSAIDYDGRPKAMYYALRRLYAPQLISVQADSTGRPAIQLVHEGRDSLAATIELRLWSLRSGKIVRQERQQHQLTPGSVSRGTLPKAYAWRLKRGRTILELRLSTGDSLRSRTLWSPLPPKDQHWRFPGIQLTLLSDSSLEVSVSRPAKNIFIPGPFSDNYFDLLPGEPKIIYYQALPDGTTTFDAWRSDYSRRNISFYDLRPKR